MTTTTQAPHRNAERLKAEKDKVFDPFASFQRVRDKVSTQVPRLDLEKACQEILDGQMCFTIQYLGNFLKAI